MAYLLKKQSSRTDKKSYKLRVLKQDKHTILKLLERLKKCNLNIYF